MKRLTLLVFLYVACSNLYGQDTAYIHTFGGIQEDGCKQVQPTADGGYILIGTTNSFGAGNTSFYAIKTDSLCNFEWSKCYGGQLNQEGFSVTTTLDKGYAFVGFTDSYGSGGYDVFLVKTDSSGNVQWQKTYGGTNWDFGYSVQQTPDSGFIICGVTYSYGSGDGSMYMVKTNSKGDTLWERTAGGARYSSANAVVVWEDSLYVVAGATTGYGVGGDTNAILLEIDNKGIIKWTRVFGDSTDKVFNSVHLTPDRGFIMYGSTDSLFGSTKKDSVEYEYLIKTDSLGNLVFNAPGLDPSPRNGYGSDARQLPDGSLLALGCNLSFGDGEYDFRAFHLSSAGWFIEGPTFGGPNNELSGSIAIGKNGDVILAGCSNSYPVFSCGLFDIFMVRLKYSDILPNSYDTIVYRYKDTTQYAAGIFTSSKNNVGVSIFPNPITTSATILIQGNEYMKYTVSLFNIHGQEVLSNYPLKYIGRGQSVALLERGELSSGEYTYQIISNGNNKVASGKLIFE